MRRGCYRTILLAIAAALPQQALGDTRYHYQVVVSRDLQQVQVQASFPLALSQLRARAARSSDLLALRACDGRPVGYQLGRGGRLLLNAPQRCLALTARLRSVERGAVQGGAAVLSNIRQWLWLPSLSGADQVIVDLQLPTGMQASVPWQPHDGQLRFGASPGSGDGLALFGRFQSMRLPVPGGALQVAFTEAEVAAADWQVWRTWLQAAVDDVVAVVGRFPNPDAQVLLVPTTAGSGVGARSPVPFGHVIRDMGEAVRFFVEPQRSLTDYLGDWTASHEFAHLLLPYVRDKWVSEGFASYYQNVLMARRGAYRPADMWARLQRSFAQADAISAPPTLMELADDEFWRVRMLVYWSGAAIALLADAQLRLRSSGEESLDTVLARVASCCLPAPAALSGEAFFALLDQHARYPVFAGLYEQFAHAPGQPPVTALFGQMGIVGQGPTLTLVEDAPLAWLRRGIDGSDGQDDMQKLLN